MLQAELITEEVALENCNHPNELILKLKGISSASDRTWGPVDAPKTPGPGTTLTQAGASLSGPSSGKPDWMSKT